MKHTPPKPDKPSPDFPLFPHATGRWAKKIRGKLHYFGHWRDDRKGVAALDKYLAQREALHSGRTPKADQGERTIMHLCNVFLTSKQRMVQSGELATRTFSDYYATCDTLLTAMGKTRMVDDLGPEDFGRLRAKLAKTRGPVALGNEITRIRTIFKFAFENQVIEKPVLFGSEFKKPTRKTIRKARSDRGENAYTPAELQRLLDKASIPMKAAMLLAMNCGYGNTDVATLPKSAIDLKGGYIDFARTKTGIPRRAPLWPETSKAIMAVIKERPKPRDPAHDDLVFLTRFGHPFVRVQEQTRRKCPKCGEVHYTQAAEPGNLPERSRCPKCDALQPISRRTAATTDALGREFDKLLAAVKIKPNGRRFYTLRHCFRTAADELPDRPAIDLIMGHERSDDMRVPYVTSIADKRLKAITNHVRKLLLLK